MGKFTIILVAVCLLMFIDLSYQQSCPLSSKVTSCSPKCLQDTECSSIGAKCCPNVCNYKSCVRPTNSGSSSSSKFGGGSGGTGSYCGNVKCSSFEKCQLDRTTKREKCVRA